MYRVKLTKSCSPAQADDGTLDTAVGSIAREYAAIAPVTKALVAHWRERMPRPRTPVLWLTVDAWPLAGAWKIQKSALRDFAGAGGVVTR